MMVRKSFSRKWKIILLISGMAFFNSMLKVAAASGMTGPAASPGWPFWHTLSKSAVTVWRSALGKIVLAGVTVLIFLGGLVKTVDAIVRFCEFIGISRAKEIKEEIFGRFRKFRHREVENALSREQIVESKIISAIRGSRIYKNTTSDILLECFAGHGIIRRIIADRKWSPKTQDYLTFNHEEVFIRCKNVAMAFSIPFLHYCKDKQPRGIGFILDGVEASKLMPILMDAGDNWFQETLQLAQMLTPKNINSPSYWQSAFSNLQKGDSVVLAQFHLSERSLPFAELCFREIEKKGLKLMGLFVFFNSYDVNYKVGGQKPHTLVKLNLN